jgi:hypothetical protein
MVVVVVVVMVMVVEGWQFSLYHRINVHPI